MSREIGVNAENIAADYLILRGYKICDRNYSCRFGEIDIIATKKDVLCFIEVKYRTPRGYGTSIDAITKSKIRKILKAAKIYLFENNMLERDYRLDAVLIDNDNIEIMTNIYTEGIDRV